MIVLLGGNGFVGTKLASDILKNSDDEKICIFDLSLRSPRVAELMEGSEGKGRVFYAQGDVTSNSQLLSALQQAKPSVVVHLSSWGMSGSPMLSQQAYDINVRGAEVTIECCRALQYPIKIIYISTYNVIYGGVEIVNGDENMPYFPIDKHTDRYSASKAVAEQIMLRENGKRNILSCVIRPAAIYGEGEQRHFPRIIKHRDSGIFQFRIGDATVDWVHIDNLNSAILLAVAKIHEATSARVAPCGRSYFISDGSPINNWEFLRPLCAARGRSFPSIVIPTTLMLYVAFAMEQAYLLLGIEPFFTRAEVYKVGVTHHFSIAKAKKELKYRPKFNSVQGAARIGAYYSPPGNENYFACPHPLWWLLICGGLALLHAVAFHSSYCMARIPLLAPVDSFAMLLFRSRSNLMVLYYVAWLLHAAEALYAVRVAKSIGCGSAHLWAVQTLLLGGPSLNLLFARRTAAAEYVVTKSRGRSRSGSRSRSRSRSRTKR